MSKVIVKFDRFLAGPITFWRWRGHGWWTLWVSLGRYEFVAKNHHGQRLSFRRKLVAT